MPADGRASGARAWALVWWRPLVGELLATALLVLLGVGSALPRGGQAPPLTHPALGFGFVVTANVQAFGAASGAHMNPAVTLAALLSGGIGAAAAAAYALAQALGATMGFAALAALAPCPSPAGLTLPAADVLPLAAAAVEALLTGTLVLVCCGLWAAHDPARPDPAAATKLGLTVAGLVYAGGSLTGASLNPARSLGPALVHNEWRHHWVYWVGPMGGAALGALLHRWVLTPPTPPESPEPRLEELPLRDKPDA